MIFSLLTAATLFASSSLVSAAPQYTSSVAAAHPPGNFYPVTTTTQKCSADSSTLPKVSALSLFAPQHSSTFYLRTIEAGYLSIPLFNLTRSGTAVTNSSDGFGKGSYVYGNEAVQAGKAFLLAQNGSGGGLSIKAKGEGAGCVLQVDGSSKGWTLCPGELGQTVLTYKGTDKGCVATYLQAVPKAPY